jgi:diaminopimelate epimerase
MRFEFTKAEGLGNDFIIVECADVEKSDHVMASARRLCDRHRGIGADGVICVILPRVKGGNFRMRIFNADGSEAEMCGNGVRCFGQYLRVTGRCTEWFTIDTLAGAIEVEYISEVDRVGQYRVNMGLPKFAPNDVPVIPSDVNDADFVMKEVTALDRTFKVTAVSIGNPHAVVFTDELDDNLVHTYGPAIQKASFFPKGVNVEFVKILSRDEIRMRVYERGCGETQACGTGACAAVAAGIVTEKLDYTTTAHLPGGDLKITWDGQRSSPVYMTGPARMVFTGNV